MRVTITGPFATAKDTARILGVSDKRLKELLRLRSSGRLSGPKKNGWALDLEKNGSKAKLEWHIKSGVGRKPRSISTLERSWIEYSHCRIKSRIWSSRRTLVVISNVARGTSPYALIPEMKARKSLSNFSS